MSSVLQLASASIHERTTRAVLQLVQALISGQIGVFMSREPTITPP